MAQNKILYSAKLDENMRRSAYFKTNKRTVKSNIMLKFVTKVMDIKLQGEADFTTTLEDPIKLLKRIERFVKKSADAEYDFLDFWEANQKFFAMKQGTTENLMHFKERFLRQAEVMQDLYGVAWFRNFAVKTKAYAVIASTDTTAKDKFKDDIFEAVLATGFLKFVIYFQIPVKTKAYAAIASTDTTAKDKFKDDIFDAVLATGFLCNCDQTRTVALMLDLQMNYCREVDYYPKTVSKAQDMLKIHMDVIKNPGVNLYQGKDQPNKDKGKGKGKGKKLKLNQIGATVPTTATVPGPSPATSVITSGTLSGAGSVNTPLRLAGTTGTQMIQVPTGNQMMQVPSGMQLMQIPTQGGGTVTVPYSMNANGEIAFSGMQLSQQGFCGAQVRQGFDATQARTPQVVKTGYFDTSNVFHDAIKGKDENGNDVYLIPCPTGTTNVELQSDWHYASKSEDLPDLATESDRGMQFIQSRRIERDPFGLLDHVIMDSGCTNTTICNGELMHGLCQAEKELDMHTNVGSRVLDEEGFLGQFPPPVYYDEDGIANVLAMREMIAAGYRITMDTDFDNAFVVHCDGDRQMRFVNRKGVYMFEQLGADVNCSWRPRAYS
ncbi:unnamed protein product [Cylindrotheca closterium]|uniref:Uncharacterized protein n=1 Tax=Cylindrotheca closterium TaxID=2856 RepID=A0AAD2G5W4_9STRA|nr:unnamed protein product [Cylindrotheca closterium]